MCGPELLQMSWDLSPWRTGCLAVIPAEVRSHTEPKYKAEGAQTTPSPPFPVFLFAHASHTCAELWHTFSPWLIGVILPIFIVEEAVSQRC